jgi:hypothetical protein
MLLLSRLSDSSMASKFGAEWSHAIRAAPVQAAQDPRSGHEAPRGAFCLRYARSLTFPSLLWPADKAQRALSIVLLAVEVRADCSPWLLASSVKGMGHQATLQDRNKQIILGDRSMTPSTGPLLPLTINDVHNARGRPNLPRYACTHTSPCSGDHADCKGAVLGHGHMHLPIAVTQKM